jgi:sulfate transport system permease protein
VPQAAAAVSVALLGITFLVLLVLRIVGEGRSRKEQRA